MISSCISSQYKIHQYVDDKVALLVSPDRVWAECEDLYAGGGDRPGSFGFLIHILDEEKTVLTGIQSNQTSKSDCEQKVALIEKILKNSKQVYIAGTTDFKELRKNTGIFYTFPKHGKFYDNGRSMQWDVLKGEDGTCVTAYFGYGKPCPWEPIFPANTIPF